MKQTLLSAAGGAETGDSFPHLGGSKMIEVKGTFDSASVAIEISLDGTNWHAIRDSAGTAIAITAAVGDVYIENLKQEYSIRAVTSGGGGSTSLTVTMVE
jgi:hypothetical protein